MSHLFYLYIINISPVGNEMTSSNIHNCKNLWNFISNLYILVKYQEVVYIQNPSILNAQTIMSLAESISIALQVNEH